MSKQSFRHACRKLFRANRGGEAKVYDMQVEKSRGGPLILNHKNLVKTR